MDSNPTIDRAIKIFRPRFRRLLSGTYASGDVADLFRTLRSKTAKTSIVREIGDLLAHPEARNKGLAVMRLRDTIATKSWLRRRWREGAPAMDDEWIEALRRNLRGLNDNFLNESAFLPMPPNFPPSPRFNDYNAFCQEANAAIKRLKKGRDGNYTWNHKSPKIKRDMSVLQFLSDRHPMGFAYELDDLMKEIIHHVLENDLAKEEEIDAVKKMRDPIGAFVISLLHGSTICLNENEYHLSALHNGPSPPSPADDLHPIQHGSVGVTAASASKGLGAESGSIFCIYGHLSDLCEQSLLDQEDWGSLSLELSVAGKLTFVDYS